MKSRIYFALFAIAAIIGLSVFSAFAQDEAEEDEIVVQTMTIHSNSPSDHLLSTLKYSYSDYIVKNKKDRTFDITVNSFSETKVIENFINQEVKNIAISRLLKKSETDKFIEKNNKAPKVTSVFKIPVVVLVHKTNSIQSFDFETLKKIFTGKITSWRELDEESVDDKIELIVPPADTEVYRMFKKVVLGGEDFAKDNLKNAEEKLLAEHVKLSGARISFMSNCFVGDNPRVQKAQLKNEAGQIYTLKESDVKKDTYPLTVKTYLYYTEELPEAYNLLMKYAKTNPVGLNSYRIFRIVAID